MGYMEDGMSIQYHILLPSLAHHDVLNDHYTFNENIHTWHLISLIP